MTWPKSADDKYKAAVRAAKRPLTWRVTDRAVKDQDRVVMMFVVQAKRGDRWEEDPFSGWGDDRETVRMRALERGYLEENEA